MLNYLNHHWNFFYMYAFNYSLLGGKEKRKKQMCIQIKQSGYASWPFKVTFKCNHLLGHLTTYLCSTFMTIFLISSSGINWSVFIPNEIATRSYRHEYLYASPHGLFFFCRKLSIKLNQWVTLTFLCICLWKEEKLVLLLFKIVIF